eukprot:5259568-Lingulodinium_polyedra.AAC.1
MMIIIIMTVAISITIVIVNLTITITIIMIMTMIIFSPQNIDWSPHRCLTGSVGSPLARSSPAGGPIGSRGLRIMAPKRPRGSVAADIGGIPDGTLAKLEHEVLHGAIGCVWQIDTTS